MKKKDIDFEQWKKQKLYEGFLDGEDTKPATSDDAAPAEETSEEKPVEEKPAEKEEKAPEDVDVSEEGVEDTDDDDGLEDDFEGETKDETGIAGGSEEQITELKDAIATLTAQIQTLTDQMKKETGDVGETNGEEKPAEETTEETAEPEVSSEETTEEGGKEGEKSTEETSEDTSEETPADETKSEAYNHFHKKGGILAENSGYLISYLNEGRFDKLEEKIMAVVQAKIRQKIEAAKTKLKTEAFNKKFGK